MKIFNSSLSQVGLALGVLIALSGCTHISVSDIELLKETNTPKTKNNNKDLKVFPLNIEASQSCYSTNSGNITTTKCSNKSRIGSIVTEFKQRGLKAIPPQKQDKNSAPLMSVKTDEINWLLERTTGLFNILTLGFSPLYHYDDYIVTYTDPTTNTVVTKEATVYSTTSWFSLLRTSPKEIEDGSVKYRIEKALINNVLDEAKIGKK